jgi:hypothetical protein
MMQSSTFFDRVKPITDFKFVSDRSVYIPVPNDCWIVSADIKNSTRAIEKGMYKSVNMVGASVIAAVNNLYDNRYELPFTFGGDGATIIVPNEKLDDVHGVLNGCIQTARKEFGLELKAGIIPMKTLFDRGLEILVAKLRLSDKANITLFWGDGLPYAEEVIKKEKTLQGNILTPDFSGLECRWNEVPPEDGRVISVIIKTDERTDERASKIYSECINQIESIFGSLSESNPLSNEILSFAFLPAKLKDEWKIRTANQGLKSRFSYAFKLFFQQCMGFYLMTKKIATKNTDWGRYKSDLVKQTDYQKFGNGLRFVITGSSEQRTRLENYLDQQFQMEKLQYGIHESKGLLITCLVKNHHREHIHFVDGMDGGYAMAANNMKKRIQDSKRLRRKD